MTLKTKSCLSLKIHNTIGWGKRCLILSFILMNKNGASMTGIIHTTLVKWKPFKKVGFEWHSLALLISTGARLVITMCTQVLVFKNPLQELIIGCVNWQARQTTGVEECVGNWILNSLHWSVWTAGDGTTGSVLD